MKGIPCVDFLDPRNTQQHSAGGNEFILQMEKKKPQPQRHREAVAFPGGNTRDPGFFYLGWNCFWGTSGSGGGVGCYLTCQFLGPRGPRTPLLVLGQRESFVKSLPSAFSSWKGSHRASLHPCSARVPFSAQGLLTPNTRGSAPWDILEGQCPSSGRGHGKDGSH